MAVKKLNRNNVVLEKLTESEKMSTNRYGLDTDYINKNLKLLIRDMNDYKPDEMRRALVRLSETCSPEDACPKCKSKNITVASPYDNMCRDCKEVFSVC